MDNREVPTKQGFLSKLIRRKAAPVPIPQEAQPQDVTSSEPELVVPAAEVELDTSVARRMLELERDLRRGLGDTAPALPLPPNMVVGEIWGVPHALKDPELKLGEAKLYRFSDGHGTKYVFDREVTDATGKSVGLWSQQGNDARTQGILAEYSEVLKLGDYKHEVTVDYDSTGAIRGIEEKDSGDPIGENFNASLRINGQKRTVTQQRDGETVYHDLPPQNEINAVLQLPK